MKIQYNNNALMRRTRRQGQRGCTLTELLGAIPAAIAVPYYKLYNGRVRFAQLIATTGPDGTSVALATQCDNADALAGLNHGGNDILAGLGFAAASGGSGSTFSAHSTTTASCWWCRY